MIRCCSTKNEKVITNLEGSLAEVEMSDSLQPEADSRIILHVSNCIQMDLINVYVLFFCFVFFFYKNELLQKMKLK